MSCGFYHLYYIISESCMVVKKAITKSFSGDIAKKNQTTTVTRNRFSKLLDFAVVILPFLID